MPDPAIAIHRILDDVISGSCRPEKRLRIAPGQAVTRSPAGQQRRQHAHRQLHLRNPSEDCGFVSAVLLQRRTCQRARNQTPDIRGGAGGLREDSRTEPGLFPSQGWWSIGRSARPDEADDTMMSASILVHKGHLLEYIT
jgi:hypothetical protein